MRRWSRTDCPPPHPGGDGIASEGQLLAGLVSDGLFSLPWGHVAVPTQVRITFDAAEIIHLCVGHAQKPPRRARLFHRWADPFVDFGVAIGHGESACAIMGG